MTYISNKDYIIEVAAGRVPGSSIMYAMGERESMGTTTAGEDVWRGNELSPAPTSHTSIPIPPSIGEQMTVVSESANDTAAGTGARTVMIHYLDANGDEQEENITMNGTTGVDTVATDIRFVNDFHVITAGSGLVTDDHIKIYSKADTGLVYNMIAQGGNKSLIPNRMVPRGKQLVMRGWDCSEAQGKRVAFRLRSTDIHGTYLEGMFLFKDNVYINQAATGELKVNHTIPELSIVKISAWPDAVGAEGACSWWGILEDT